MIQPGLERISLLLKNAEYPWKAIHVAGTNGKGSICHYAATFLKRRTIKIGTFNSPHLVDRWDCIKINGKPISELAFKRFENHFIRLNNIENINASPFEILTATAFACFNNAKVKVGIVEVGMGGKLDATNILNNQCVSVISKIARDHEAFLGKTLEEIAKHKAGILRPNVPYIVNPSNEQHVQYVIDEHAKEIGAGPRLLPDTPELRRGLYAKKLWKEFARPLCSFQRDNVALAILAAKEAMNGIGTLTDDLIASELTKRRLERIPGRLEFTPVIPVFGSMSGTGRDIIVDGAHNVDAAHAMHSFIMAKCRYKKIPDSNRPRHGWPVTWVLAMTDGKDATNYLKAILRPGDKVITTSFDAVDGMPWVKPMDAHQLLQIAEHVQPDITALAMPQPGALRALCAAKHLTHADHPIVLTGSLYLVGDFYRSTRDINTQHFWYKDEFQQERTILQTIHNEEEQRIARLLHLQNPNPIKTSEPSAPPLEFPAVLKQKMKSQVDALERDIDAIKILTQKVTGRKLKKPTPLAHIGVTVQDDTYGLARAPKKRHGVAKWKQRGRVQ